MAHHENENTVLIEIESNKALRVIRCYLSERRATEDLELLRQLNPGKNYAIQSVEFIDN